MMKSEVNIHRLVREHTDTTVPQIVYYDFSQDVIERDYLIMEYLEGNSGLFDEKVPLPRVWLRTGKEIRFRFGSSEDKAGKEAKRRPTGW
ncbi:MAG TPA: hypothetical protein VMW72_23925 [Sedimentisphaerales bacterium]|nr:hypothetical protein [Sedimentisphaerales bacterium]